MLVNVSRFTAVQNKVASSLHLELEDVRRAVRLHGKLPAPRAAEQSSEIAELAEAFELEFADCDQAWPTVLSALYESIAPIRVQPVNQLTGAKSLDYGITDKAPGVRVIAVGGNSLSRGLTLEGLSTSYFLRDPRAYDTLLQMGRWFGYRDGYRDLCRVWLTEEAEGWYRHVTEATGELKRDFARMRRRKATPREFGLRVWTHPDTLLITARNKMATGLTVDVERDISLIGRGIESTRLYSDEKRNKENLEHVDRFFGLLVASNGPPIESPHRGAVLWPCVPAAAVDDMLDGFLVHPLNFDFQGESIAKFLREAAKRDDPSLSNWTVALPIGGKGSGVSLDSLREQPIKTQKRHVKVGREDRSLLVSGKSARVGSRRDVRHGLSVEGVEAATGGKSDFTEDELRAAMSAPLLLVFLLQGFERVGKKPDIKETQYRSGLVLPALGLHFPGIKDPDAPKNLIRYRLNRVAQEELLPTELEDEEAEDDVDIDD